MPHSATPDPRSEAPAEAVEREITGLPNGNNEDADLMPSHDYHPLRVVGLGGSAGSLAALQKFFSHVAPDLGAAFIVVLHLAPEFESSMAEILQRCTKMPVAQVTDQLRVEPDHVYIIPPGKLLSMVDGHLSLNEMNTPRGKRVTVDLLFRTLAETHGSNSVAIILSGADSDGCVGMKRIKERGGLTIAQELSEAEHQGMPRAAIETGMVDWILPVLEMPIRVAEYFQREARLQLPPEEPTQAREKCIPKEQESEEALREVLAFLRTRTGRDFSYYKRATILRRIGRRMQVNGSSNLPDYLVFLRTHPGETGALLQDLLISVTNFFRDPEAFQAFEQLAPSLFQGKGPNEAVRVWVPACATGEEAYSIAIILSECAEKLESPAPIQIFATDIDDDALGHARAGHYVETIQADVSEDRLRRFFIKDSGRYRVKREIREIVLFALHDALKDPPFSRLDLISCRNFLIYLSPAAQTRAFEIFHFALNPGGHLFLGSSESAEEGAVLFHPLDKKHRLFARREVNRFAVPALTSPGTLSLSLERARRRATEELVIPAISLLAPGAAAVPEVPGAGSRRSVLEDVHFRLIERLAPPSVVVNGQHDIVHLSEQAGRFLKMIGGMPSVSLLSMVHPMLRVPLRTALFRAMQANEVVEVPGVPSEVEGRPCVINLRVQSGGDLAPDLFVVVFEEKQEAPLVVPSLPQTDSVIRDLERELEHVKACWRDTVEQSEASTEELKASNEELQAMNEELRSATEELETSREELQSINEELTTVNQELKLKVDEVSHANSDLQNLMASTNIATIFLDRELCIKRYTPPALAIFHIISTDVGRPLSDLRHRLAYDSIATDALQVLETLTLVEREIHSEDGKWFLVRLLPYRTTDNHIAGVVLTLVDITDRKLAEQAVQANEGQFRRAIEAAPFPVMMFTEDGTVLALSRVWTELTGYALGHLPTIDAWLSLSWISTPEVSREESRRLFCVPRAALEDLTIRTADGQILVWSFSTSSPGLLPDGRRFLVGMGLDITARKEAENQLRASEERLRVALQAGHMGTWDWNLETDEVLWSREHNRMYGLPLDQREGTVADFMATLHPEDRGAVEHALRQALDTRTDFSMEMRAVHPDGSQHWISGHGRALYSQDGAATRMIGVVYEVTERKEAEAALKASREDLLRALGENERARKEVEAASQAKDHFLAVLSHELRTPLMPVIMTTKTLSRLPDLPTPVRESLAMIERNVRLEARLIDDLLDLTRIGRGSFEVARFPMDVHEAVRKAVEICGPDFAGRSQRVRVSLEAPSSQVSGDSARLEQVFWNLLKNASKFSPNGTEIIVHSRSDAEAIFISFQDQGIGIDSKNLASIFGAFTQADDTISRRFGGLGLGLAISHATVTAHQGEIVVTSEGKDCGATFTVKIPLLKVN